jgi:cob(I)alamin adenosyltransferase
MMSYRLTKIYTRKGDEGYTSLGERTISKDELLVEAVGMVDELNAHIGLLVSQISAHADMKNVFTDIQHRLFDLGGELHMPDHPKITAEHVTALEKQLDAWNQTLPPLKEFILPGGNQAAAVCHITRTVCRRAERSLVRLHRQVSLQNTEMLRYLNRLSDLFFVAARVLARETSATEPMWEHK